MYSLQHNSKGKYHLVDEEEEEVWGLCGSKGALFFTHIDSIKLKNGLFYWQGLHVNSDPIDTRDITDLFCKKCIKKALKNGI